jgi:hypothetical protein
MPVQFESATDRNTENRQTIHVHGPMKLRLLALSFSIMVFGRSATNVERDKMG